MEVIIQADTDEKTEDLMITNKGLENFNFVEIVTSKESYVVSLEELYSALLPFKELQKEYEAK